MARLIGEGRAEAWFQCELRGFGSHVVADKDWPEYAEWSGRYNGQDRPDGYRLYWVDAIEQIEGRLKVARVELHQIRTPDEPIRESAAAWRVLVLVLIAITAAAWTFILLTETVLSAP